MRSARPYALSHAALDKIDRAAPIEERNVLLPWNSHHHPKAVSGGCVEQPHGWGGIKTNGVYASRRHGLKIALDRIEVQTRERRALRLFRLNGRLRRRLLRFEIDGERVRPPDRPVRRLDMRTRRKRHLNAEDQRRASSRRKPLTPAAHSIAPAFTPG